MTQSTPVNYFAAIVSPLAEELRSSLEQCAYAINLMAEFAEAMIAPSPADIGGLRASLCELAAGFAECSQAVRKAADAVALATV